MWLHVGPYFYLYIFLVLFMHMKLGFRKFPSTYRGDIAWDFGVKIDTNIPQITQKAQR